MTNTFNSFIEQELKRSNLDFEIIEDQVNLLLKAISKTDSIDEAEIIFKVIEDIQFILAKESFKEGKILSPFLKIFVHDFDRIDDQFSKNLHFRLLKGSLK